MSATARSLWSTPIRSCATLPDAHVLHVVRNPWSAYADTQKRPVPLSLANYMLGWTLNQYYALLFQQQFPQRLHIVRTEDVLADPRARWGLSAGSWAWNRTTPSSGQAGMEPN